MLRREPLAPKRAVAPLVHRTVRCTPDSPVNFSGAAAARTRGWRVPETALPWSTGHVRCTPDSPVPSSDRWLGHVSRADCAADRWPCRPLAHRTVQCTPDSPVNFSRTPSANSRERPLCSRQPGAPDTVRCTTGQSGAPDRTASWLYTSNFSLTRFLLFQALRHNTLVFKTMY